MLDDKNRVISQISSARKCVAGATSQGENPITINEIAVRVPIAAATDNPGTLSYAWVGMKAKNGSEQMPRKINDPL